MGAVLLSEQDWALTRSPAQPWGLEPCPTCCVGRGLHLGHDAVRTVRMVLISCSLRERVDANSGSVRSHSLEPRSPTSSVSRTGSLQRLSRRVLLASSSFRGLPAVLGL